MMRSRSRSRPRNTNRSRSRSPPYLNRVKPNHRYEGNKPFRGNPFYRGQGGRHSHNNRHRGDFRQREFSPRRSPPHFNRERSRSPMRSNYHLNVKKQEFNNHHPSRQSRSPPPYESNMYRRSPTPQRHTIGPIPKEPSIIFVGPGGTLIEKDELKKITVDIRRNLPRGAVSASHGPIRYIVNPSDVTLVRRPGEGSRPIFDREELKPRPIEERVIKLAPDAAAERLDHQRQSSPPSRIRGGGDVSSFSGPPQQSFQSQSQEGRSVDGDSEGDLRFRLMEKKSSEEMKERMNADPNYVPQGRYYYEHDNREKFNNRGRGGFVQRGRGNYQHNNQHPYHQQQSGGSYRGNSRGGGGGNSSGGGGYQQREQFRGGPSYRGKRSPDWTHDLYDAAAPVDDGKPSSTTPM